MNLRQGIRYSISLAVLIVYGQQSYAQSLANSRAAVRYEVNAKRTGTDINSDDALPRSREFKRIDSSYYVGWMYEGVYKFNHAADYLGFKNAAIPLEHALYQMERDYRKELRTRTSDLMQYFPVYAYHIDYTQIAYYLVQCYSNTEEPEKMYSLLRRVLQWNFQRDYYLDTYNYLFWVTHRNRYYTSAKYSFLKNTIDENEQLANRYLDSQLRRIERNRATNAGLFQPGYERDEKLGVYHYKSIYYSYRLKIDSAAYYYNLLRNTAFFPHNNYATFRAICGDFREAEEEYQMESMQERGDKRLKEWVYYTSIIDIYKAQPKTGVQLLKDMVRANGSTPGFGWYNIALARCAYYDGQLAEANRYLKKAAEFKELHIGTTLGQTHYDFSIQLVKLLGKQSQFTRQKFENRNWWYNPKALGYMARYLGEQYMQQFLIINQFAQNPERDRVIYKLFATESTVSWDEVWYLIKDFSTRFFLDKFSKELQTDERKYIRKYFQLFTARLEMKQGDHKAARKILDNILASPDIDKDYEKLFLARVYQAQAECAEKRKDMQAYQQWVYRMYITYPQLLPDTDLQMNMRLHTSGQADAAVVNRLKDCNINWVASGVPAVDAYAVFSGTGSKKRIEYYVTDASGKYLVEKQSFGYNNNPERAGIDLAYKLFGIGGKDPFAPDEEPEQQNADAKRSAAAL